MIQEIVDGKRCFGCGACRSVCPVSAIEMTRDRAGFLVPVVDTEACLGCGACTYVCPSKIPIASRMAAARRTLPEDTGKERNHG